MRKLTTMLISLLAACAILACDSAGGMEASVVVTAGSAEVTNLNDFPWYGLVTTINDRYTNRQFLGNPDRPYLRHDSAVEPGETDLVPFGHDFFDDDGNQWRIVPFRITAERVMLEAKSQVNGPYDLTTVMTVPEPARSDEPRPPISVRSGDLPGLTFTSSAPMYEAVKEKLEGVKAGADLTYRVSPELYEELKSMAGITPEDEAIRARWAEQFDVHWPNIDAFHDNVEAVTGDRVLDRQELERICFLKPQWEEQLRAAHDYVVKYRKDDPDKVAKEQILRNLEDRAERGLDLLAGTECP